MAHRPRRRQDAAVDPPDDDEPFVFAGLWDVWTSPSGDETLTSATIVTQPANAFMATIHSRMPAVLDVERAREWIAPANAMPRRCSGC